MLCFSQEIRKSPMSVKAGVAIAARGSLQKRKPVRGSLIWWLRWIGVAAFISVLWFHLPRSQRVHVDHLDLRWLGLCMLLAIGQLLLDAFIWHWLLSMQRIRYPSPKTLLAYLSSHYLGLVTPGHVGEFLAAGYISMDTGITFGYALSSVVVKKLLAWLTVIGFGVWSLPLLARVPFLQGVRGIVGVSVTVLIALLAGIALWVFSLRKLARRWERLSPWQIEMTEFWAGMRQLRSARLLIPLGLSAVSFSLLFVQLDAVLRAMGLHLPLFLTGRIVALSRIAARLVPISVIGFGSKDAATIVLLSQQGIDPAVGLTATLIWLLCSYLVILLLSGVCWWIKPLVIHRAARSR